MAQTEDPLPGCPPGGGFREVALKFLSDHGISLVLLAMIVAMSFASPAFLSLNNVMNVVRQVSVIAIVGIGVTMVIITTGIDLASGSVIALVSVVTASVAHPDQFPVLVPVAVGLAAGALTGAISGTIVAVGRIPAFIATLGMMIAARGVWPSIYSRRTSDIEFFESLRFHRPRLDCSAYRFPFTSWASRPSCIHVMLAHTRFGKHVYAIGGNQQAAVVSGINVTGV